MEFAIWLITGLIVGGAIGALATWWISRARGGAVSVMQLKQENDRFRNEVTEHFVETARLINQMTDSYKQVFDHLSSGAEKLVDDKQLAERLPPASGQEVRLGGFGSAAASDSDSGARPAERAGSGDGGTTGRSGSSSGTQQTGKPGSHESSDGSERNSANRDPLKTGSASQAGSSEGQAKGSTSAAGSEKPSNEKQSGDKPASGADSDASKSS